ncbi:MAG: hypothetical protein L0Z50_42995, partial [Verrucomicrobiales bacterium]|nr:hypothetical protein [Verrucomicrobiales bacterium]
REAVQSEMGIATVPVAAIGISPVATWVGLLSAFPAGNSNRSQFRYRVGQTIAMLHRLAKG